MNKILKLDKKNKKGKNKILSNGNTIAYTNKDRKNLIRYRDEMCNVFVNKFIFLEKYRNSDILGFLENELIILFIKKNKKIFNYVISVETQQYIYDKMLIKDYKKAILNDKYNNFNKTFDYSRIHLYKYEIDLLNDINDWLNDDLTEIGKISRFLQKKNYNILFTNFHYKKKK